MSYLGVDLRTSTKHPSAVSVIDDHSQVDFIGSFAADSDLFQIVEQYQPTLIAIGTPLGLPEGALLSGTGLQVQAGYPSEKGSPIGVGISPNGHQLFLYQQGVDYSPPDLPGHPA